MSVVEKDSLVHGMLEEELKRCRSMIISLEESLSGLPKGSIQFRQKKYRDKLYSYAYLKYRNGQKSMSKHIPQGKMKELREQLDARKKIENERGLYRARIKYLEKILKVGKR